MTISKLIEKLNNALSWELRAINMYAHYSAYVQGIQRLQLEGHFTAEVTESIGHANIVRSAIVKLGGEAITDRNPHPIIHTTDYIEMLKQAYETEKTAGEVYGVLLELLKKHNDDELYDSIETIYFAELRSVEEVRMLLN
jgi:bacterioferritin (cytochrome b1)|tara:strand:+ start:124 stop:543 length:420 start_codon:yes stop_codon:yes gene_type:complete